jgi:2-desacetyl-2-hydroxyethyl bacteriochlorophyllide A dehydrogenase
MRAVIIAEPGRVEVASVDDPSPGPDEVVVSVAACGICGTDIHILEGDYGHLPIVPGHEFAGQVVEVGSDVRKVHVGDQVATDPNIPCRTCYECRRGRLNLCENLKAIGVTVPGAAAEFVCVPAGNCVLLPEGTKAADAALIEPLSCAVRAFDVIRAKLADRVLIFGAGTMGLMNLQLAKRSGAATVSVVDTNPDQLQAALQLGCSAAVTDPDELDSPHGWDVVIDCTGVVSAIEDGLARVARGGTFLQFGVTASDAVVRMRPYRIYHEEITIMGSMAVLNSFDRAADLFYGGILDPDIFVSDRVSLDDYASAIQRLRSGSVRKILVSP